MGVIAFQLIQENQNNISISGQSISNTNGDLPKNLPPGAKIQDVGGGEFKYMITK